MTVLVLAAAAVFPVLLTGLAAWAAGAGSVPWAVAAGVPAVIGWAVLGILAAYLRPRRGSARRSAVVIPFARRR